MHPMLKRKSFLIVSGAFIFLSSSYVSLTLNQKPIVKEDRTLPSDPNDKTRAIYDSIAKKYDSRIRFDEYLIGVTKLRRNIINKYVHGPNVLEVASGTGRNFDYFWENKNKYETVTCTDYSREMLQEAFNKYDSRRKRSQTSKDQFSFKVVDAHALGQYLPNDHFDTVIDTYGLCSFNDPKQVVREMAHVCAPDGTLIFLEHGKSKFQWLTNYLDKYAHVHHSKWGCWWNRDIEKILRDCSDILDIKEIKRYQFGTCYCVIAKPIKVNKIA